jgi:hypothetical protein
VVVGVADVGAAGVAAAVTDVTTVVDTVVVVVEAVPWTATGAVGVLMGIGGGAGPVLRAGLVAAGEASAGVG